MSFRFKESKNPMSEDVHLAKLATEQRNPASESIDLLDTVALLTLMNDQDQQVAIAVQRELPAIATAVDVIAERLRAGGRLIYIGAGTSGRLGVLDASECPPTFNTPPSMVVGLIAGGDQALRNAVESIEDQPEAGAEALRSNTLTAGDVVVGIAASGRTPFVLGAMRFARDFGAFTIALCNSPGSVLSDIAEITIAPLPGPEILTGSTRLKAGTAQKMVLNMLSTGAMIRIGKTYGNLMVDVQPTNAKLKKRATRIVRELTGVGDQQASESLSDADGEVKTAITSLRLGIPIGEARERLRASEGNLRAAITKSRQ